MAKAKTLHIRINDELKEKLILISKENERGYGDYLTELIKYAIKKNLKYSDLVQ